MRTLRLLATMLLLIMTLATVFYGLRPDAEAQAAEAAAVCETGGGVRSIELGTGGVLCNDGIARPLS
jgi:hypothetical protein